MRPQGRWGRSLVLGVALLLAAAAVLPVGCASQTPTPATTEPSARVVQRLLELRLARSRDVAGYRLFFREDSAVPTSLAEAATKEAKSTRPPIPAWEPPYVSSSTTSTAEVVVVWKATDAFPGHSQATVFTLAMEQGRWVVLAAREVGNGAPVPTPSKAAAP